MSGAARASPFALAFDPVIRIALLTGASALVLTFVLVIIVIAVRLLRRSRLRRQSSLIASWRPILFATMNGERLSSFSPVAPTDLPAFLALWNHFQESTRGEARGHLNSLLRDAGFIPRIQALLHGKELSGQLLACTTLGHLRLVSGMDALLELTRSPHPALSFAALKAVLRIDASHGLRELMIDIARRHDWPVARLALVFRELGAEVITAPMESALSRAPAPELPRLLHLARLAHHEPIIRVIRTWIRNISSPEVLVAAIDFLTHPEDIPLLRGAARHKDFQVRAAAAKVLGKVGGASEKGLLLDLMRDKSWSVRYSAAEALLALPGITEAEVLALRQGAKDRFAADILNQAWAERRAQ